MKVKNAIWVFTLFATVGACTGEKSTDDAPTVDEPDEPELECEVDDGCDAGFICEENACVDGDRSNGFDEAVATFHSDGSGSHLAEGVINPAGDIDYFSYVSTGSEWVRLVTTPDETAEPSSGLDTVVKVYTEGGLLWAYMDDYATGPLSGKDTVLQAYLPHAGTWFFTVEDWTTHYDDFDGVDPVGSPSYVYQLELMDVFNVTSKPDSLESPETSVDMTSGSSIWAVGVVLNEDGDNDYVEVSLGWDDAPIEVYGQAEIPGSDATPLVNIYRDGELLASKEEVGPNGKLMYSFGEEGTYVVEAADAYGTGGDAHWYVLYFRTQEAGQNGYNTDFQVDSDLEPNNTQEMSTFVPLDSYENNSGDVYNARIVEGMLWGEEDEDFVDEDWFGVDVTGEIYLNVNCIGDYYGGLADIGLEVYTPDGEVVAEAAITPEGSTGAEVHNLDLTELGSGLYGLRLFSEGDEPVYGPGATYVCRFYLSDYRFYYEEDQTEE